MVRCITCKRHKYVGNVHTCTHCKTKKVYGQLQDMIIEHCSQYESDEKQKASQNEKDEILKSINEDTVRKILVMERIRCFYCKQWVGHCAEYKTNRPKSPSTCPYYIREEVKRRREEYESYGR